MEWLYGIFANLLGGLVNNALSQASADNARHETFSLNEKAAANADQRTRNLYNDLFGVQAQYNQVKGAGLSPSLFYKGAGISGSSTGQIGAGAGNVQPQVFGIDPAQAAQIRLANAQAKNLDADTLKKKEETKFTEVQKEWQEFLNREKRDEQNLMYCNFTDSNGNQTSLFEIAGKSKNYEEYLENVRQYLKNGGEEYNLELTQNEKGQSYLRSVYQNAERFDTYIEQLGSDKIGAEFQKQLIKTLKDSEFAKLNKDAAIQYLKTNISSAQLTETQKKAWNRLLDKLGTKGEDLRDIIIVLSMIANQMATTWHMPTINATTQNNYRTTNNYEK